MRIVMSYEVVEQKRIVDLGRPESYYGKSRPTADATPAKMRGPRCLLLAESLRYQFTLR